MKHLSRKKPCDDVNCSGVTTDDAKTLSDEQKNQIKVYKCEECNASFTTKYKKYYHKKTAHGHSKIYKDVKMVKTVQEVKQVVDSLQKDVTAMKRSDENSNEIEINTIKRLKAEISLLKNRKSEAVFQKLLEHHLNGKHKKLSSGYTDITTEYFHAEIKSWNSWKAATGQLFHYNFDDPKKELRLYFFGNPPQSQTLRDHIINRLADMKIMAFEILDNKDDIILCNLQNGEREHVRLPSYSKTNMD
jgi:hypothetical protein